MIFIELIQLIQFHNFFKIEYLKSKQYLDFFIITKTYVKYINKIIYKKNGFHI